MIDFRMMLVIGSAFAAFSAVAIAPEVAEVESDPEKVYKKEVSRNLVVATGRSEQAKFRKEVLTSSGNECLITKENLKNVL